MIKSLIHPWPSEERETETETERERERRERERESTHKDNILKCIAMIQGLLRTFLFSMELWKKELCAIFLIYIPNIRFRVPVRTAWLRLFKQVPTFYVVNCKRQKYFSIYSTGFHCMCLTLLITSKLGTIYDKNVEVKGPIKGNNFVLEKFCLPLHKKGWRN